MWKIFPNRSLDDLKGEVESIGIYDESGAKQISENAKNVPRGRLERNIWQQLMAVWQRCSVATLQCGSLAILQYTAVWHCGKQCWSVAMLQCVSRKVVKKLLVVVQPNAYFSTVQCGWVVESSTIYWRFGRVVESRFGKTLWFPVGILKCIKAVLWHNFTNSF